MDKDRLLRIILWSAIALALILIALHFFANRLPSLSPAPGETCNTLIYNGAGKINLLFFAQKSKVEEYTDNLFKIEPFSQYKGQFNVYYITKTVACPLYDEKALLCYSKDLLKEASVCPNDYIVVVDQVQAGIRSSSYMNVLSLNLNHPLNVFPHEIAHALANLAEEYVPADIPRGSLNCVSNCSKFRENANSCFGGCSKEDYFRSIDKGLMRTLYSSEYGLFDESLISDKIIPPGTPLTGNAILESSECINDSYYLIESQIVEGKIKVLGKTLESGCRGSSGTGPFSYNFILTDDTVLASGKFNPEIIFTDSQTPEEEQITGEVLAYKGPFFLKVPIVNNAKTLLIQNQNIQTNITLEDINSRPCRI